MARKDYRTVPAKLITEYRDWVKLYSTITVMETGDLGDPWHTHSAFMNTHPGPEWHWVRGEP